MLRRPPMPKIAKIDMTPMVGILTSLLILFIVTTPIYGCGIWVELPQISAAWPSSADEADIMTVGITAGGTTFFKGVKLEGGLTELGERVGAHIAENPRQEPIVHLKADVETRYARVIEVLNVSRKAGATDIRLIAESPPRTLNW